MTICINIDVIDVFHLETVVVSHSLTQLNGALPIGCLVLGQDHNMSPINSLHGRPQYKHSTIPQVSSGRALCLLWTQIILQCFHCGLSSSGYSILRQAVRARRMEMLNSRPKLSADHLHGYLHECKCSGQYSKVLVSCSTKRTLTFSSWEGSFFANLRTDRSEYVGNRPVLVPWILLFLFRINDWWQKSSSDLCLYPSTIPIAGEQLSFPLFMSSTGVCI